MRVLLSVVLADTLVRRLSRHVVNVAQLSHGPAAWFREAQRRSGASLGSAFTRAVVVMGWDLAPPAPLGGLEVASERHVSGFPIAISSGHRPVKWAG